MNITDHAGVSGTNVVGVLSRAYDSVVKVLTAIEEVAVAHQSYKTLVARGMDPATAAAKVFDQVGGRPSVTKPSKGEPAKVLPRQQMQLAA